MPVKDFTGTLDGPAVKEFRGFLDGDPAGESPSVGDVVRAAVTGYVGDTARGLGYGLEKLGIDYGRRMREGGDDLEWQMREGMTPGGRRAMQGSIVEGDGVSDLRMGDKWGQSAIMQGVRSIPQMVMMALPGGAAAHGLSKIPAIAKAAEGGSALAKVAPTAVGFGAAEGVQAGATNAAETKSKVERMSEKDLARSPRMAELMESLPASTPFKERFAKARTMLADEMADEVFQRTAVWTGGVGALTGGGALGALARGGAKNPVKAIGGGALTEAIQEFPQSGGEHIIQNAADLRIDPAGDPYKGALAGALSGAVVGAGTGGVLGAGGYTAHRMAGGLPDGEEQPITERVRELMAGLRPDSRPAPAAAPTREEQVGKAVSRMDKAAQDALRPAAPAEGTETSLERYDALGAEIAALQGKSGPTPSPEAQAGLEKLTGERETIAQIFPKTVDGGETDFATESNVKMKGRFALAELGDLTVSHDAEMKENPRYPQQLQPRDRTAAGYEVQVSKIAGQLNPERLGASPDVATGAPITGRDGVVESGNGRAIALDRAYTENGEPAKRYREWLAANAPKFGLDPAAVESMKRPVLVRVRETPVNRSEFARQANAPTTAQMSPLDTARSDAKRMGSLEGLESDDVGNFMIPKNDALIRGFFTSLPITEQTGMVDKTGRISQAGQRRFQNALLVKAYGDASPTLVRMVESLDDTLRGISTALVKAAPALARAKEAIKSGAMAERDITADVVRAVDEVARLRAEKISIAQFLAQSGMFQDLSPVAIELVQFIDANVRSPNMIARFIQNYLGALAKYGAPGQDDMFGAVEAPSSEEITRQARKETEDGSEPSEQVPAGTQAGDEPAGAAAEKARAVGAEQGTEPALDGGAAEQRSETGESGETGGVDDATDLVKAAVKKAQGKPKAEKKPETAPATKAEAPVDAAAHAAATSPNNDLDEPSDREKKAGNYPKGHPVVAGMDISIENPEGSKRRPEWPTLKQHYGYIRGTIGFDKDHVDVFVKPGTPEDWAGQVFVVNQNKADGSFDEHKAMLGFESEAQARAAYLENYTAGWEKRIDSVFTMNMPVFKAWVYDKTINGPKGGPVGELKTDAPTEEVELEDEAAVAPAVADPVHQAARDAATAARDAANAAQEAVQLMRESMAQSAAKPKEVSTAAVEEPAGESRAPMEPKSSGEKIVDAGENLTANRRNFTGKALGWDDLKGLNDALKVREAVKAKVWPRPDYEQLIADGMPALVARAIKQVYDGIATAPEKTTDENLKKYVDSVSKVREAMFAWANDKAALKAWADIALKVAGARRYQGGAIAVSEIASGADSEREFASTFLRAVWPEEVAKSRMDRFRSGEALDEVRAIGGNRALKAMQVTIRDVDDFTKEIVKGWPAKQEAWQRQGYNVIEKSVAKVRDGSRREGEKTIPIYRVMLGDAWNAPYLEGRATKEEATADLEALKPFILLDKRRNIVGTFETHAEAEEAARGKVKREGKGGEIRGMNIAAAEREGPAHRAEGDNVTSERLMEAFGFRGVNFGREGWINQTERQAYLNHAYDGLMDLAGILDVPPKALSMNGLLGIAFGAQGRGGTSAAHFVAGVNEINLTKTMGAGTLAHEWGHAFDHYFAVQAGQAKKKDPFLSEYTKAEAGAEIRPEIVAAMKTVVEAMNRRPLTPDEQTTNRSVAQARDAKALNNWLRSFKDRVYRGFAPGDKAITEKAMERFDALADRVRKGDLGDGYVRSGNKEYPQVIAQIRALVKDATGHLPDAKDTDSLAAWATSLQFKVSGKAAEAVHAPQTTSTEYGRESAAKDSGKAKKYWSTEHEMFARAFETYIADKLVELAQRNTFLTDAHNRAEARDRTGEGFAQPYPRGEDRKAISAAIDKLVSALETRETDKGVAMASRQPVYDQDDAGAPTLSVEGLNIVGARRIPGMFGFAGGTPYQHRIMHGETLVGFTTLNWKDGKVLGLLHVEVAPSERGKGIAEAVVSGILSHNDGAPLRAVYVVPKARGFWEKMGAEFVKTEDGEDGILTRENYADARAVRDDARQGLGGARPGAEGTDPGEGEAGPGAARRQASGEDVTQPQFIERAAAAFGPGVNALFSSGLFKFTETGEGLPTNLRKLYQSGDEAWYDPDANGGKGEIHFIGSQIRPDRVVPLILHELGEHHGLPKMLGPDGYARLQETVRGMKDSSPKVGEAWAHVRHAWPNLEEGGEVFVAEVIAKVGESGGGRSLPFFKRLIAAVRQYLVQLGFELGLVNRLSAEDVAGMVVASARRMMRQAERATKVGRGTKNRTRGFVLASSNPSDPTSGQGPTFGEIVNRLIPGPAPQALREAHHTVANTPAALEAIGLKPLPMMTTTEIIEKAFYDHGVLRPIHGRLPELLADPVMIFDSDTQDGTYLVVTTEIVQGMPLVVAVRPDGYMGRTPANIVTSFYPRKKAKEAFTRWWREGKVRYLNTAKRPEWQRSTGLQLPKEMPRRGAGQRLLTQSDLVKKRPPQASRTGYAPNIYAEPGDDDLGHRVSWDAPEASKLDNVLYTMQDKHIDTRRVLQAIRKRGQVSDKADVYLQEELFHGRAANGVDVFLSDEMKPLLSAMTEAEVRTKEQIAEFERYLQARHAEERNVQIAKVNPDMPDAGSGMSTKDAADHIAGIDAPKLRQFERLAAMVDAINAETRQLLVSYGLESADAVKAWEEAYKHYVPLQREDMDAGLGIGRGYSVKGPSSKRATGSKRKVVDILANIAMQRERAIVRGEKNRVANALVGLASANENTDFWKVDQPPKIRYINESTGLVESMVDPTYKTRPNIVIARMPGANGEIVEHSVVFNEHDERSMRMAQALKNLDMDDLGQVLGVAAKITRYFSAINTQYNPVFGVINFVRDSQGALFNLSTTAIAGKQVAVLQNALAALRGIYIDARDTRLGKESTSSWAQLWEEFQKAGGQTGYRDMFRTSKDRAEAIERELKRISEGKVKHVGRAVFDWLSDYNTSMENAIRLSAYKVAKDAGMTEERAASLAKNLTVNFNRKGQIATQAGALYAFFNASVQGTARMAETLRGPMGKKIMAGGVMLGVAQALMLAAAGFGDDEPPEFVRERNLILPIGDGKYLTLAMPLGLHVLPNIGRIAAEFALNGFRDPGKKAVQLVGVFAEAFNPVGNAGLSLQTIAPTVADPLVALAENRDWTGKPIAREDFNKLAPTPGHVRAKDTASAFSKAISKALNWSTGGTNYKPGMFSPTPDQIDYLIGQVTGGVGREVIKAEQTVVSMFTGEDLPTHKIPLLGRFYGTSEGQSSQANSFYANLRTLNEHEAEIKGRRKAGEPLGDYFSENPEARFWKAGNTFERTIAAMRRQRHALIERDADREMIKALDARITNQMRRFNEMIRRAKDREAA